MTALLQDKSHLLRRWQGQEVAAAVTQLLDESPLAVIIQRIHFPAKRHVQINLTTKLRSGIDTELLAEYCPTNPHAHMRRVLGSLNKSRNGQKAGLTRPAVAIANGAGLVIRRKGLDERLPGLRLLYDAVFARQAVTQATGRDPGSVSVALVAHRLGKRAVLRITSSEKVYFARLRAVKSGDGEERLARHRKLWVALGNATDLRIPEPLGALPGIGVSFFGVLAGDAPDFGPEHSAAIAQGLCALQGLDPEGLPHHSGHDEARILADWLERCRVWRPDLAARIIRGVAKTIAELETTRAVLRPCHRDLHEKQILMADGTAGFLDFDTLSLADPALDAGNLLAHLFMAGIDETPLRSALDYEGLDLWRRAALFRLAMIYGVTSMSDTALLRLIEEALRNA